MILLSTLKFVAFKPQSTNNTVANRSYKLTAEINEQIQLATDADCTPTKTKWMCSEDGVVSVKSKHQSV